jgi:hypothetical protein
MEVDYPAAHSMDTVWFAIDADGHVAYFFTGEAGAAPGQAVANEEAYTADDLMAALAGEAASVSGLLIAALPACEAVHDPRGRQMPGAEGEHVPVPPANYAVLMFLDSLEPVREEVAARRAHPVPAAEGVAVVWRPLTRDAHDRLHQAGLCRGCFWDWGHEVVPESLARRGVFVYRHITENWISGPYGRAEVPERPVHVDQLPPSLRRHVKQVRFEGVRFAQTPYIQPLEHAGCVSWECAWIDATGRHIRPIPGKEEAYARAYREYLGNQAEHYQVEPPAKDPKKKG